MHNHVHLLCKTMVAVLGASEVHIVLLQSHCIEMHKQSFRNVNLFLSACAVKNIQDGIYPVHIYCNDTVCTARRK